MTKIVKQIKRLYNSKKIDKKWKIDFLLNLFKFDIIIKLYI